MKYECIYLRAFAAGSQARKGNCRWLARYTVEQTNKRDNTQRLAVTDQPKFHGPAVLTVNEDVTELQGQYWQNRSLDRGLNAVGLIVLRRRGK